MQNVYSTAHPLSQHGVQITYIVDLIREWTELQAAFDIYENTLLTHPQIRQCGKNRSWS
jgi:hypothetical protein